MAPSSTPSEESRRSVLAARDARQAELDRRRGGGTLVAASLAIPGAEKTPPGADALFAWAVREVEGALPGARLLHASTDGLGPFSVLEAPGRVVEVKARCVRIEAARPAARLVDLDVYSPQGAPVDRASLRLPPRACLCCDEPAHECVRLRRHDLRAVVASARALLAGFAA
jgi:holo-ACP synthase